MNLPLINDFATRSFRDYADQDYISARVAYRNEFDQQFRWCSLQAIEKYLKAVLLFNQRSAKGLGHNIDKALRRVISIDDLEFTVPDDVMEFVEFLSVYGPDRYLSHPTYLKPYALLTLDKSVWCIRRYCFYMRGEIETQSGVKQLLPINKQRATNPYFEKNRHKYRLLNGYLETVIDRKKPSYDALVWKNFFYGRVKKHRINNFRSRMSSHNPTHNLHPEVFAELSDLVDFPAAVKKRYAS
ncbi:MAG: HEPN domain-containing protein [Gammaproteobacteria bacterium]